MANDAGILELFRLILQVEAQERIVAQARTRDNQVGTYGNITRSTAPMWQSQTSYHNSERRAPMSNDWLQYWDSVEPEIPDYMRVSEGL